MLAQTPLGALKDQPNPTFQSISSAIYGPWRPSIVPLRLLLRTMVAQSASVERYLRQLGKVVVEFRAEEVMETGVLALSRWEERAVWVCAGGALACFEHQH